MDVPSRATRHARTCQCTVVRVRRRHWWIFVLGSSSYENFYSGSQRRFSSIPTVVGAAPQLSLIVSVQIDGAGINEYPCTSEGSSLYDVWGDSLVVPNRWLASVQ